ncbi:STAS domain-containing protein [Methylocucumis oryzae]|uniref:Anti-sigma factor antagonist n=1 Tax=Methylocucumis oryzae TaxID=1632867 RepID=A0A0F3ILW8_9GAMM|nr:STAS domain-containing protein [Methylocucumis oryzae]KJV07731.1 hypothetical protein VZ94_02725 [Methylocucumis oryzae]
MQIHSELLTDTIFKVVLSGRLDMQGAQAIDMKFTALTATRDGSILVDISDVSFLSSLGIRTILSAAKAVSRRGGLMVLFNPQPNVMEVLEASGVSSLIPIYTELALAINDLTANSN